MPDISTNAASPREITLCWFSCFNVKALRRLIWIVFDQAVISSMSERDCRRIFKSKLSQYSDHQIGVPDRPMKMHLREKREGDCAMREGDKLFVNEFFPIVGDVFRQV